MTAALTLHELLIWNQESSDFWKGWLDANSAVLALPCDIGRATTVQEFVRHIWAVDLVWARRVAGLEEFDREKLPAGPIQTFFDLHLEARGILSGILKDSTFDWDQTLTLNAPWLPLELQHPTRRKALAHALTHAPRHWAQLATLVRTAGYPSNFKGDLVFSTALA
jgi:uncharacterized damage-inducible protein DinB